MSSQLNSKYVLHNKLLITFKMIFPTKEPDSVETTLTGGYKIQDKLGDSCLTYSNDGLLTATVRTSSDQVTDYYNKVVFMCHVSSFSRFDNIWKIEQQ